MKKEEGILISQRIKEVKIFTRIHLYELEQDINKALKEGWEIYGDVIERTVAYSIMMVKYEDNISKSKKVK